VVLECGHVGVSSNVGRVGSGEWSLMDQDGVFFLTTSGERFHMSAESNPSL